jgi:hypothetical protein
MRGILDVAKRFFRSGSGTAETNVEVEQDPSSLSAVPERATSEFDQMCEAASAAIVCALSDGWWAWPRDPEVRANLIRLQTAIGESRRICARLCTKGARREAQGINSDLQAQTAAIIRDSVLKPNASLRRLDVDSARQLVSNMDELLLQHGDNLFLFALAEEEYLRSDPQSAAAVSWIREYGDGRLAGSQAFRKGGTISAEQTEAARNCLLALHRAQWDLYNLERGRATMKAHFLKRLTVLMILMLVGFGAAIGLAGSGSIWSEVFLAASAGAIGASLSAAFKVRDQVRRTLELMALAPIVVIQPVVGAIAGLFVLLVLDSGFLEVNPSGAHWATWGAVSFLAGFSEPFFLYVVGRVADVGGRTEAPKRQGK